MAAEQLDRQASLIDAGFHAIIQDPFVGGIRNYDFRAQSCEKTFPE
jgi:hypothetical protein